MNNKSISRIIVTAAIACASLLSGCASVAVSDDAITKNTAAHLGVDANSFTITDRENNGIKTTYLVTRNNGQKYNCYVTGGVSITGRVVSDPICQEIAKSDKPVRAASTGTTAPAANSQCNALLKAAGKC
ncbi:MAG TPA: hypothetical protein VIE65_02930 [Methylobacter sp.]|jgi:uncharacterized protein YceK